MSNVSMQNLLEKSQESGLPQLNINSHIKKKIGQTARVQCNRTRQMCNHYPKQTWIKIFLSSGDTINNVKSLVVAT